MASLVKTVRGYLKDEDSYVLLGTDESGDAIYTTTDNYNEESTLLDTAGTLAGKSTKVVAKTLVDRTLASSQHEHLSKQQAEAVRKLVGASSKDLGMLTGFAGTGKTSTIAAAVDCYKKAGFKAFAIAPTNKSANILGLRTGLDHCTIHRFLYDHERTTSERIGEWLRYDGRNLWKQLLFLSLIHI